MRRREFLGTLAAGAAAAGLATGPAAAAPLPPLPKGVEFPFSYAYFFNCEVLYRVPLARLQPFLAKTDLEPAVVEGAGCAGFNYQCYGGQFPWGVSTVQEVEITLSAVPRHRAGEQPELSFRRFALGDDQTKLIGNHRVWVPCDNQQAIDAAVRAFGENKFHTTFQVAMPSANQTGADTWAFTCLDPADASEAIFTCSVDTRGLDPESANLSPLTEYGSVGGRTLGCRLNVLQPYQAWLLDGPLAERVQLTPGRSAHPMRRDMEALFSGLPAAAVRTFESLPVAIQSRAYYP